MEIFISNANTAQYIHVYKDVYEKPTARLIRIMTVLPNRADLVHNCIRHVQVGHLLF